jgi:hypothetical protein
MFSDRDNFIVASTILVTSSIAKKIPRDVRMSILKLLRDTKYTSITDAEWHEIAQGINNHKKDVTGIMMKGLGQAMFGGGFGEYSDKMKRFDDDIKKSMEDLDMDELKKFVDDSEDPKIRELWLHLKQMKRDFDDKQ